jgi:hypothetical protein
MRLTQGIVDGPELPPGVCERPNHDLVIVRLGLRREGGVWDQARDLAPAVQAFPPRS